MTARAASGFPVSASSAARGRGWRVPRLLTSAVMTCSATARAPAPRPVAVGVAW